MFLLRFAFLYCVLLCFSIMSQCQLFPTTARVRIYFTPCFSPFHTVKARAHLKRNTVFPNELWKNVYTISSHFCILLKIYSRCKTANPAGNDADARILLGETRFKLRQAGSGDVEIDGTADWDAKRTRFPNPECGC